MKELELKKAQKIIMRMQRDFNSLNRIIENMDKPDVKDIPGIDGTFDGNNLIAEDGEKYEVPGNYAAKSRLVFGDVLKRVEVDGKVLFKLVDKVRRKKVEGILSKKEGSWYFLSDSGSYRISDVAAEFNKAEINDEAVAIIPEENLSAPYAALDRILKEKVESLVSDSEVPKVLPKPVPTDVKKTQQENEEQKNVVAQKTETKKKPTKIEKKEPQPEKETHKKEIHRTKPVAATEKKEDEKPKTTEKETPETVAKDNRVLDDDDLR